LNIAVNGGTEIAQILLKIFAFVFQRWTKDLRVWNDMKVSYWWQNVHFGANYPSNSHLTWT